MQKIYANYPDKLYQDDFDDNKFIAYDTLKSSKNKEPYIIFSHGLMSNRYSSKALAIESFCTNNDLNYIRFDNFGSGDSSGNFQEQNISSWLEGLMMIVDQLTSGKVILVGSSKGAWLTLLAAQNHPKKIQGIVNIASATDFTEEVIWNQLSEQQQQEMLQKGSTNVTGKNQECNYVYPISRQLIEDGRKHLLLNKPYIDINCPIHFIHGMKDCDVPYSYSTRTADKIKGSNVVTKLVKDGDHKLSRPQDIEIISNSIKEILTQI